jgi:hypothetical protein
VASLVRLQIHDSDWLQGDELLVQTSPFLSGYLVSILKAFVSILITKVFVPPPSYRLTLKGLLEATLSPTITFHIANKRGRITLGHM